MHKIYRFPIIFLLVSSHFIADAQTDQAVVSDSVMESIYNQIKTPYKYGLVLVPSQNSFAYDCPTVFRRGQKWFMTYIVFDGRGYETWIAKSNNLLNWAPLGRILSFTDSSDWDCNQKAGYPALEDYKWGRSYNLEKYDGKYWMSYIGGNKRGYEAGVLSIGIGYTKKNLAKPHEWSRLKDPVLSVKDKNDSWWDSYTLYKSTIIWDKSKTIGYPFVMYYNAKSNGKSNKEPVAERVGMAVSKDMVHWQRFGKDPVLDHHKGITGDPYIEKIGNVWVMFYFGAWWGPTDGAFNRFACSYDMVHWTDWKGDNLIEPSEPYDNQYAHKSSVIYYNGVVYHFYCATNKANQRGIAVAMSKDLGNSVVHFVAKPKSKKQ